MSKPELTESTSQSIERSRGFPAPLSCAVTEEFQDMLYPFFGLTQ
jgi:hypothetical protein